ncbi:hypothetical protein [Pseudomonas lactis]|nr:hypothetical protein [Pseudomonas lactis]NNA46760.1 hypothetical protein [Pseudomonas lactis]GLH47018.1 hypothetical protein RS3R2_06980 [Pseudomonas lactis]
MQKLIPRGKLQSFDPSTIELISPFSATSIVEFHLPFTSGLLGLSELIKECDVGLNSCVNWKVRKTILDKIKSGEWLLVSERTGALNHLHAQRCIPSGFSSGRFESEEEVGPGKWAFFSIDYDAVKNTAIIAANRLGSMGDQGRVFGSDGKDLANTTRTLIQQWVPLNDFEEHRIADSAVRRYGELRHTPQRFLEGEDKWQIGGKSWHWQPVTPDEAYEKKEGAK